MSRINGVLLWRVRRENFSLGFASQLSSWIFLSQKLVHFGGFNILQLAYEVRLSRVTQIQLHHFVEVGLFLKLVEGTLQLVLGESLNAEREELALDTRLEHMLLTCGVFVAFLDFD